MSLSSRVFLIRLLGIDVQRGSLGSIAIRHAAKRTQSLQVPTPQLYRASLNEAIDSHRVDPFFPERL